jgi:hypothetical protein
MSHTVDPDHGAVDANRAALARAIGLELAGIAFCQQVHGDTVARVAAPGVHTATDALATDDPAISLLVLLADCAGLVLYAPDVRAIGVAHLGWRGATARLGEKLARSMAAWYGADPAAMTGAISPAIGPCCYEVGADVQAAVRKRFAAPERLLPAWGRGVAFDIPSAIRAQLADVGIPPSSIEDAAVCTRCKRGRFFSHRGDGAATGRHALLAALPA